MCIRDSSTKPSGIRAPATRQVWCGWVFDTVLCIVTITDEKLQRAIVEITLVLDLDARGDLLARQLAQTAGLLSHIGEVFIQGKRRLHHVWAVLNAAGVYQLWARSHQADPIIHLSPECRHHLGWYRRALQAGPPCRPMFCVRGSFTTWSPKSPDFEQREELISRGEILSLIHI